MAIMTENGVSEKDAAIETTYEVRSDMLKDGMSFLKANMEVMRIRKNDRNGIAIPNMARDSSKTNSGGRGVG